MIHFEPGEGPRTWRKLPIFDGPRWILVITCPKGHDGSVMTHTVDASGVISPSVVCPIDGCSFHATVALNAWEDDIHRRRRG